MAKGVNLSPPWLGIEQDKAYELSQDKSLTLPERMTWLVLSQMLDNGHAPFAKGEIYEHLSTVDRTTGEVKPMSRRTFFRTKKELIRRGILAEDQDGGNDRCFIVSGHFDRAFRPPRKCFHDGPKPRRDRSSTPFDGEPPY